jgi:PAS domain S-box-containing protein
MPETNDNARTAEEAISAFMDELPLPYLELDSGGFVVRANKAAAVLSSAEHGSLIGMMAWAAMPTDEQQQSFATYLSLMQSGEEPHPVRRNLFVNPGEFRPFELHRRFIRDAAGKPVGMRVLGVDISSLCRELEEMRRTQRWLECSLESAPEAVIIFDAMGFIQRFNPAAEALLGWTAAEASGQCIETVVSIVEAEEPGGEGFNPAIAVERMLHGTATVVTRSGTRLRLEIHSSPVIDQKTGSAIGVVESLRPL